MNIKEKEIEIHESKMLEEIRMLLKLSIEDFVYQMNWPNTKFYGYIKNGRKRPGDETKQNSHPTINKVFVGINYAIENYEHWSKNKEAITLIVVKYLLPTVNNFK